MRILHLFLALADQLLQRVGRVGTLSCSILCEEDNTKGTLGKLLNDTNFGIADINDSVGGEISAGVRIHSIGDVVDGFQTHRCEVEERSVYVKLILFQKDEEKSVIDKN